MRRQTLAAAALLLFAPGWAPAQSATDPTAVPRMSMEEFKPALAKGSLIVLDVRDISAFRSGHIPGAQPAPNGAEMGAKAEEYKKSGKTVVTYCA